MRTLFRLIGATYLVFAISMGAKGQALHGPESLYAKVGPLLEKTGGALTPELRKAYLNWAEDGVQQALRTANRLPPADCLADISQDDAARAAIYGAVYPPDPSILQNYAALRQQLGPQLTTSYRSLIVAFAVARRIHGVELTDGEEIGRENQASNWIDVILRTPANAEERAMVQNIAVFLKDQKIAALDLYRDEARQRQFVAYLKGRNQSPGLLGAVKQSVQFGEWIKNAMILDGMRPPARDPRPASPVWLKHLIATFESAPKSSPPGIGWPLFPVKTAPWPLLMPLVHAVPLTEANYIWESFQGEHGDDRFHTYGPYRDDVTAMPDMLLPSKWFWDAFPDRIVHGGECIPISKGTVDLYSSLGRPAMAAAQPGHSNLISFQRERETWKADIEQDFAGGPHVTFAQWFFDDEARADLNFRGFYGWAGAEYQLGLALGMNLGEDSYSEVRMACNLFRSMSESDQKTVGRTLLLSALEVNPFDPEPWYQLFQISDCEQKFQLAMAIRAQNPAGLMPNARCDALDNFLKSDKAGPAASDLKAYWGNLEEFGVRNYVVTGDGPHDEASMMRDFQFLQGSPSIGPQELADFAEKFIGGSPPETLAADTAMDLKLSEAGDAYGRFRMGQRYLAGDGVPESEAKAKELFAEAAKRGDAVASVLLDRMNPVVSNEGMEVTASSTYSETQKVVHLIDGAGMVGGTHDNSEAAATMWTTVDNPPLTSPAPGLPPSPAWVRINFPHPQWFDAVEIWNLNQPNLTNRGFKRLTIYGSPNGSTWYQLTLTAELPQANGQPGQFGFILDHSSSQFRLKSVIIAAEITDGNYGGASYGLGAVRFVVHAVKSAVSSGQIGVTASSEYSPTQSVQHLIDGSGMTGEYHDNSGPAASMWQTSDPAPMTTPAPGLLPSRAWVRFTFHIPASSMRS